MVFPKLIFATLVLVPAAALADPQPLPVPGTHPTALQVAARQDNATSSIDSGPENDLWQRIRRGFVLEELRSPLVAEHESWYASRPDYIQRFVDRGSRYLYHVVEEVERRGMPTEVALLPIIESAFNPQAYSRAKAAGMWQFIPSTGKNFGLKQDWLTDNRRDVLLSTHAAMDYLQKLYGMFGSWELALAAYNCGEGCVSRAIQKNARKGLPGDFLSLNLPAETRHYVPKLIAVKNIVLSPGDYGLDLTPVENRPYFAKVAAPERIDVKLAARLAEMDADEFAALNPASNRPVAATSTGYFLVPAEKADVFRENLELYRTVQGPMVSWQVIHAKRGESLDTLARRYGMTASYLRATGGPFREKKGKLTQPASFMVPVGKDARAIESALEKKVALKNDRKDTSVEAAAPAGPASVAAASAALVLDSDRQSGQPAPATQPAVDPALPVTHVVQRGETLFSIARQYGMSVAELQARNPLRGPNLPAGKILSIAGDAAAADAQVRVAASAAPQRDTRPAVHVVRSGETLFAIATRYGVQLGDLLRWNRLTARSVIQPGGRIRLQG